VAGDASVCWDCLELRLRLHEFVSDKAGIMEGILQDAVLAGEVYEPAAAGPFLRALVAVLEGNDEYDAIVRDLVLGIEQADACLTSHVQAIEAAMAKKGATALDGLRRAAEIG
jgi:hypothetical protein